MLSRHAISTCHVTCQRQMELDSVMALDVPLCSVRRQICEVPEPATHAANQRPLRDSLGVANIAGKTPWGIVIICCYE